MAKKLTPVIFTRGTARGRNLNTVIRGLGKIDELLKENTEETVQEIADIILDRAVAYAPKQYGGLRESGRAAVERRPDGNSRAVVSFGGASNPVTPTPNAPKGIVDYALIVHEKQIKYLEQAAIESIPEIEALLKKRTPDNLNKALEGKKVAKKRKTGKKGGS